MQKIAEHNIQPYGTRGISISLPKVFAIDNNLVAGDQVEIYRDQIEGKDALIILAKEKEIVPDSK